MIAQMLKNGGLIRVDVNEGLCCTGVVYGYLNLGRR